MNGSDRTALVKAAVLAFVAGALMHVVAVTFALLSNIGERLLYFLTPGGLVSRELGLWDPSWSGLVNVGIAMVANGLAYMAVASVAILVWRGVSARE